MTARTEATTRPGHPRPTRNAWLAAGTRTMRAAGKALHAALATPRSAAREFELRYRRYLAEFGECDDKLGYAFRPSSRPFARTLPP